MVGLLTKFTPQTMNAYKLLVFFVAVAVFATFAVANVSALPKITGIEINGIEHNITSMDCTNQYSVDAGETIPVRVNVFSIAPAPVENDVHIVARWRDGQGLTMETEEFDVIAGNTYTKTLNMKAPSKIDPSEPLRLEITLESFRGLGGRDICFTVQRTSNSLEILNTEISEQSGRNLPIDVVVKNRGRHIAEDTFVRATIVELGITRTVLLGDLYPEDQGGSVSEEEDTLQGRLILNIPATTATGVYTIEIEAFDDDASTVETRRVVLGGSAGQTKVIPSSTSKTFASGTKQNYILTLVNTGDSIKVYSIVVDAPKELNAEASDSVVVVPAGSSKTVNLDVTPSKEGTFDFTVRVYSDDELIGTENFVANVEGTSSRLDASIVLTVVLAVIFVVLVIVLIVLLTRKPQKSEEFGESYY